MKSITRLIAISLLSLLFIPSQTEARTFYNDTGKSIEAELIGMENEKVIFKLKNGKEAKVPLNKLAKNDQLYVKTWWAKNKNLITDRDVRLSIRKKSSWIVKPTYTKSNNSKTKTSESSVAFTCELNNYSKKTVSGMKASYSTYKRVSTRDNNGSNSHVDIINDTSQLDLLPSRKSLTFTTEGVSCKDSSVRPYSDPRNNRNNRAQKAPRSSHSENVVGFVLTLSVNGKEILTKSHPENFLRQLAEEEKREERKSAENGNRQDSIDKGYSSRKDREDVEREKRKNKELKEKKDREAKRRREIEDREDDYKDRNSDSD